MNKKYWFFLDVHTHIAINNDSLLLYNSLNGKTLEYLGWRYKKILNLIRRLHSTKNLGVVSLNEKNLQNPVIAKFVPNIRDNFFGDLIDISYSKGKPIQMFPIVNINRDVKKLKKYSDGSVGENIMEYLKEIRLYLNNSCNQNCGICNMAYRQFPFCTINSNKNSELDLKNIKKILESIERASMVKFNILGGNIFNYPKFIELTGIINHLAIQKIYYAHYANVLEKKEKLEYLNPSSSFLKILVPTPINQKKLEATIEVLQQSRIDSKFIFAIQSEEEFEKAEAVISRFKIDNSDYQPFYNEQNLEFFKKNIFTTKEEILEAKPNMKTIYTNSVVNSLNFGRLTILSNGHIHANVNMPRLGILGKDSIYDVLYKEMYHGKSWRRIRKNVEPCKHCTYQALCPPLSNYTYALGRNNLCHNTPVNKETKE